MTLIESSSDGAAARPARTSDRANRARHIAIQLTVLWALVVLAVVSEILYPGFFDKQNLLNLVSENTPTGLVAFGMTFVIIGGGFDLSVGALSAVGSVLAASFSQHLPVGVAFGLVILIGGGLGFMNGFLIARIKINPFVTTLATASILTGAALLYSSQPITPFAGSFSNIGSNDWLGVPIAIYIFVALFLAGAVLLGRTVFGRSVYAIGGNEEAARLAGLRVDTIRTLTYVISGLCATFAGIIVASRIGAGQSTVDSSVTLNSIAIVVIGGTSLIGGEGAMWRTLVGLLIIATINNLFNSLALAAPTQECVLGGVLIAAVAADRITRGRQ
jgi:ribose transport system permease protein